MLSSSGRNDRRRTVRASAGMTAGIGLDMDGLLGARRRTEKLARSEALVARDLLCVKKRVVTDGGGVGGISSQTVSFMGAMR